MSAPVRLLVVWRGAPDPKMVEAAGDHTAEGWGSVEHCYYVPCLCGQDVYGTDASLESAKAAHAAHIVAVALAVAPGVGVEDLAAILQPRCREVLASYLTLEGADNFATGCAESLLASLAARTGYAVAGVPDEAVGRVRDAAEDRGVASTDGPSGPATALAARKEG